MGSVGPFQVDFDRVAELMEIQGIKDDLDEIRLGDPYALLGSLSLDPRAAEIYSAYAPISSDEYPILEFSAGRNVGTAESWAVNHEHFLEYRSSIIPYLRFSTSDSKKAAAAREQLARVEKANMHIDTARLFELKDEADNQYRVFHMTTLERRKEYEKALEIYPDDENVPVFLDDGETALLWIEEWAKREPTNAQALFELGCAYRGQRRYPEAIAALTKASKLAGENDRYRKMLRQTLDESRKGG